MDKNEFIKNFRNAFGNYELPIAVWYSEEAATREEKTSGCFIKHLKPVREGNIVSLSLETISCRGGRVYCGFMEAPPSIPSFVSEQERYKKSPEMVSDFIANLNMPDRSKQFINFASIDRIESFENIDALIFFATPDVLTGLISWTLFDTNEPDAVSVPFGSGCSSIVSQPVVENRNNGYRVFIGLFDPSVRPHVEPDILSFAVPMSRFRTMYHTLGESCLNGTNAWSKVKDRIESNGQYAQHLQQ
jgi:uncharacterized protein (DUF169 family)